MLEKALIVITDVTASVEKERLEQEQREALCIFERIVRDKSGFLEFFAEADEQVVAITSGELTSGPLLKRLLHTVKGNSLTFGIQTVADACHAMESTLTDESRLPTPEALLQLSARWSRLRANLDVLMGTQRHGKIEIEDAKYQDVLKAVLRATPAREIARRIAAWKPEPTTRRLERVAEHARSIARRLNKGALDIQLDPGNLRLDAERWSPFWGAFVHVVRNALDHGLEGPERRLSLGKSAEGRLELSTLVERDDFVIALKDDGQGIEWPKVAERAAALGLPSATASELLEALFEEGVTTGQEVTEISGRGIGMGAVRAACQALSGRITLASEAGKGTRIEFRFPRERMADDPLGLGAV